MMRSHVRYLGPLTFVVMASLALGACGDDGGEPPGPSSTTTTTTQDSTPATPEAAIEAYLADRGEAYVGDCSEADPATDIGKYCSILQEDEGDSRSYLVGPVASEGETIVVVRRGRGWEVTVPDA